ncbi:hormogonium polysaccharide biosynthesis protein HpsA [Coleofasciculus sp. F4-SAH-05]|uniref:hormogonium polysaccharide biosynthesis protein HpsA n=1 Tax=Coleofasciculus sp. F4-SAH-05 TaxID=3069525 RepID=UPI0032FFA352
MSTTKKLIKTAQRLLRNVLQVGKSLTKQVMNWLLRNLFVFRRHPNASQAGFVLPTVIMVMLVVTLLTTAILFRSFDRAKNASNVRINQATLSAAAPSLDRAKAKIEELLNDPNLPRGTPGDTAFKKVIEGSDQQGALPPDIFDLPDETRLEIKDDQNNTANTGWLFPVDTDNNGKFDSVTVYSILYKYGDKNDRTHLKARSLPMTTGNVNPACAAAEGTSASLIGGGGWVSVEGTLKKSIFVYVATVPITDKQIPGYNTDDYEIYQKGNKGFSALELQTDVARVPLSNNAVVYEDDVEIFAGTEFNLNGRIFTNSNLFVANLGNGLTFRQVSSPDSCFYEEENSKMVAGGHVGYGTIAPVEGSSKGSVNVHLFQGRNKDPKYETLSSQNQSATETPDKIGYNNNAYEQRIAKLIEAADGKTLPQAVEDAIADFINEDGLDEDKAKEKALDRYFRERTRRVPYAEVGLGEDDTITISVAGDDETLRPSQELMYPYDPYDPDDGNRPTAANVSLKTAGNKLKPAATKFENQEQQGTEEFVGDRVLMGHNLPELRYDEQEEEWLGKNDPQDIVGTVWDEPEEGPRQRKTRVTTLADAGDTTRDGFWENAAADQPEDSFDPRGGLRVVTSAGVYFPDLAPGETLADHGSNIVWPDWMPVVNPIDPTVGATTTLPASLVPYENQNTKSLTDIETDFGADLINDYDSLDGKDGYTPIEIDFIANLVPHRKRPFLRMRAAAVYHYTHEKGEKPIACVATYYDPTNWLTARNLGDAGGSLPALRGPRDVSGDISLDSGSSLPNGIPRIDTGAGGSRSINGITFEPPALTGNNEVISYLRDQVYPNGRYVNPLLRQATTSGGTLIADPSLAESAAYHSTQCALQIYGTASGAAGLGSINPTETPTTGYELPHGTIRETAFLDARQIKAVDRGEPTSESPTEILLPTGNYDLPIEQRYPLEIRATVLDLDKLRQSKAPDSPHGDKEYMLPNSGIIYATRDDALADASDIEFEPTGNGDVLTRGNSKQKLAATDFRLDPTRRPNGIMLINGAKLYREREFREVEKGLTVASNLPVYIKAQPAEDGKTLEGFNPHQNQSAQLQQEFTGTPITPNSTDAQFYGRRENQLNKNFACRIKDDRLPDCKEGDEWRPATVLSDGITLLSSSFREGFRNEGDYDLRNNQIDNVDNFPGEPPRLGGLELANPNKDNDPDGANRPDILSHQTIAARRLWNGFWNNDFAINGLSSGTNTNYFPPQTTGYPTPPSTPLNDITPAAFPSGQGATDDYYSTASGTPNGNPPLNSSYFNNMVTPVQRRLSSGGFVPEYVMEYCPKTLISECQPTDWIIGTNANRALTSWDIFAANYDNDSDNDITKNDVLSDPNNLTSKTKLVAGTTAEQAQGNAIGKPRRVAFLRDQNGGLIFDSQTHPIPLGISKSGEVQPFPYNQVDNSNLLQADTGVSIPANIELCAVGTRNPANNNKCLGFPNLSDVSNIQLPRNAPTGNSLWYATVNDAPNKVSSPFFRYDFPLLYRGIADRNDPSEIYNEEGEALSPLDINGIWLNGQPLLLPVLQLQATTEDQPIDPSNSKHRRAGDRNFWLPWATVSKAPENTTIFNLVLATKDSPSRPAKGDHEGDIGGALSIMPRFLENWVVGNEPDQAVQIDGSFIQIGRSYYGTAPYYQLPNKTDADNSLFGDLGYPPFYNSGNQQKHPIYVAATRSWGFDVGLLSQIPDLFGQNFAIPPDDEPTTFFREVSRDDPWLKPLLCAKALDQNGNTGDFALPETERPSSCP